MVAIIGVLAAIAIPAYLGQQDQAKDNAARAQLRAAATSQQLFYARTGSYANTVAELEAEGFRQGEQAVSVRAADGNGYCMEAPGGTGGFSITQDAGRPVPGGC